MTAITLAVNEPQEVVANGAAGDSYQWRVIQGDVRLGHTRQDVDNGRTLEEGDRGTVTLRERSESIWAQAVDAQARMEIHRSGFDIDIFPRKDVQVVQTVETNAYQKGGGFDFDGSNYPYSVDPGIEVHEIAVTTPADIVLEVTTTSGDVFEVPLAGSGGTFDHWEVESFRFLDPNVTLERVAGGYAGE